MPSPSLVFVDINILVSCKEVGKEQNVTEVLKLHLQYNHSLCLLQSTDQKSRRTEVSQKYFVHIGDTITDYKLCVFNNLDTWNV